jgi:hypothetical protein
MLKLCGRREDVTSQEAQGAITVLYQCPVATETNDYRSGSTNQDWKTGMEE